MRIERTRSRVEAEAGSFGNCDFWIHSQSRNGRSQVEIQAGLFGGLRQARDLTRSDIDPVQSGNSRWTLRGIATDREVGHPIHLGQSVEIEAGHFGDRDIDFGCCASILT